jgi:hypothetical protein
VSVKQPDTSVVVLVELLVLLVVGVASVVVVSGIEGGVVLDVEVVVTKVVVVAAAAHEGGRPPVQLHSVAWQATRSPFLHFRLALPLRPAQRVWTAALQLLVLHGLRAHTGDAVIPTPSATASAKTPNALGRLIPSGTKKAA